MLENTDIIRVYKSCHVKNLKWPIRFKKIKQLQFFKTSRTKLNKERAVPRRITHGWNVQCFTGRPHQDQLVDEQILKYRL